MDALTVMAVVAHIIVWDSATGTQLAERWAVVRQGWSIEDDVFQFDAMETCRVHSVEKAKELTALFKRQYPFAFTNVDCQWERVPVEEPA